MENISNITAIIDLWPKRAALAEDIGVSTDRVHKWAQKSAIPARFHFAIIEAAQARGFAVDADLLVRLHSLPADAPELLAAQ